MFWDIHRPSYGLKSGTFYLIRTKSRRIKATHGKAFEKKNGNVQRSTEYTIKPTFHNNISIGQTCLLYDLTRNL